MISADTNLFIYAADPDAPQHEAARSFFADLRQGEMEFVLCELVLVEIYLLLRNPAVFRKPYSAQVAMDYCQALKGCPDWRCVDYAPEVSAGLWQWAGATTRGYRAIVDARLALTLRHHGVTQFASANVRDFEDFGFERVWNPLAGH